MQEFRLFSEIGMLSGYGPVGWYNNFGMNGTKFAEPKRFYITGNNELVP